MGEDRTPLEWLMSANLMEKRNKILSYPLRAIAPVAKDYLESDSPHVSLSGMAMLAYAAMPTFLGNIVLPMELISAGMKPQPWLVWKYGLKSPAYEAGARIGSAVGGTIGRKGMPIYFLYDAGRPAAKVGAKIGGRIGSRLIPGVGWAMLAYDVYDIAANQSLWGFKLY